MSEAPAARKDGEFIEHEVLDALTIGGIVGHNEDRKKVNFHRVNTTLDRETAYDVTLSILKLQVRPVDKLSRIENYRVEVV